MVEQHHGKQPGKRELEQQTSEADGGYGDRHATVVMLELFDGGDGGAFTTRHCALAHASRGNLGPLG